MLTREDDVDIHALPGRAGRSPRSPGMSAGTARRSGTTWTGNGSRGCAARLTIRSRRSWTYVHGAAGRGPASVGDHVVRRAASPWGSTASYPTLTRQIRARRLRPVCSRCGRATERANAIIEHPAGEETQWDWLDLPDPPDAWGWGSMAHLLVGSLAHSGRWRGYLSAIDGPAAPGRGAGPDQPGSGRADPAVAVRPDGHRLPPRLRPGHRHVRRRREALRGDGHDLPTAGRAPQRGGGEGQPHRGATLVADPAPTT